MAIRIKSQWHDEDANRSAEEIGGAIALSPVGLAVGLIVGGAVAVGLDHLVKAGVEKIYNWKTQCNN